MGKHFVPAFIVGMVLGTIIVIYLRRYGLW